MLVTPESNRRNLWHATATAGAAAATVLLLGLPDSRVLLLLPLSVLVFWAMRRRCRRRLWLMRQPFPPTWELILNNHVAYFRALEDTERERFRQMVRIFLDEIRISGVRTEVDDTVRVLVAASAVIPVFGFHDWDYHRLGEVLIYPGAFDEKYQTTGAPDENTLGMVGLRHLSGVMILSKPNLLRGFDSSTVGDNVGIHEFTHLVEQEEERRGLPPEVPWATVKQWVQYVGRELSHPSANAEYINPYAYTNEHEYLAVLSEYFFKSPEVLRTKNPQLYAMLRRMFHQDTRSLLARAAARPRRIGRNERCPCGSGKKYKDCCLEASPAAVSN